MSHLMQPISEDRYLVVHAWGGPDTRLGQRDAIANGYSTRAENSPNLVAPGVRPNTAVAVSPREVARDRGRQRQRLEEVEWAKRQQRRQRGGGRRRRAKAAPTARCLGCMADTATILARVGQCGAIETGCATRAGIAHRVAGDDLGDLGAVRNVRLDPVAAEEMKRGGEGQRARNPLNPLKPLIASPSSQAPHRKPLIASPSAQAPHRRAAPKPWASFECPGVQTLPCVVCTSPFFFVWGWEASQYLPVLAGGGYFRSSP